MKAVLFYHTPLRIQRNELNILNGKLNQFLRNRGLEALRFSKDAKK